MSELFLLDPGVVFLNHGSFGACPRPVFEEYQRLQLELERQPVEFLGRERRFPGLLAAARERLASYVGADAPNLVFVPNATSGLNAAARSLRLRPGDEVVVSDHEYGGVDILWRFVCAKAGAQYVRAELLVPFVRPDEVIEELWAAVTQRTRAICVSHVASSTALRLPVEEICRRAREEEILSFVDGAHAPGQVALDLESLGADVYAGNCHKWLGAPKGAGFLYVRPEHHAWVEPPVVSWDWRDDASLAERFRWQATRDPAAYLTVPAAIDFQEEHGWEGVRERCHRLADRARVELAELFGLEPIAADASWFVQMVASPLPLLDPGELQRQLYERRRVEVPVLDWNGHVLLRASFQAYNDEGDLDRLLEALRAEL